MERKQAQRGAMHVRVQKGANGGIVVEGGRGSTGRLGHVGAWRRRERLRATQGAAKKVVRGGGAPGIEGRGRVGA